MTVPPPLAGPPVPPCRDSTAELEHIAAMLGWSIGITAALALALLALVVWLVFGRGPSQGT